MEDSVAEAGEVADAIRNALENLRFVVAAFGIAVGIGSVKGVEYVFAPVVDGSCAFIEFGKSCGLRAQDPVGEKFFSDLRAWGVNKGKKFIFK